MKGQKKIFHANSKQKRARMAILIRGKIGFKSKTVTRDKEGHSMLMKGSIYQEYRTIINN